MKVVIAIDSFKGCMTSVEANMAAAEGIRGICSDAIRRGAKHIIVGLGGSATSD